jgi:NADH-quinone oxidoreductase chain G
MHGERMKIITITINGKEIKLEKAMTVLEAARSAGIKIPTLCYHEQLEKYGGCRLCLVEVEKMPRLQTACTLTATDGMVVRTETEQIVDVRRGVLEFLLINHPLDCPYCDKAGECDLQDLVEKYGPAKGRYKEKKRKVKESLADSAIVRNMERCVMCTRCVRMCEGKQGASAIAVIDRGGHSHIEPFSGGKFDCEYCGNCVSVCPVGAIMSRLHRHRYRSWQVKERHETVCAYCGVGCTVVAQVRDDIIMRVVPKLGSAVNNGMLCSRGRFGYEFVGSKDRLTTPLIKKNGMLTEATWEEAITFVARKLSEIKAAFGSQAIAGIASPRCTNEDNYLFQKFMRAAVGTNNIDTTARTGFAGAQGFLENIFGQGVTANLISGLANSDTVMVIGGDPTTINPILGLQIRACARRDGTVLTVGSIDGLRHFNPMKLLPKLQTEATLLEGIVAALREKKGLPGSNAALEAKIKDITISAGEVTDKTGVTEVQLSAFVDLIARSETFSLVIGKDIVQSTGGSYKLLLLSAIHYLAKGRIYLLSEKANEQGSLDMGCAPDILPGYRPVVDPEFRKKCENVWQAELSDKPGLNLFEMVDAAEQGSLKAVYVMGENLFCNIPNSGRVEAAFSKLDFLVVQDIFLTETAKRADVVLPALSWAEKDGTFTNMERRIQRVRKSVHREGMEDGKIIAEISKHMGYNMDYKGAEDLFHEAATVSPLHRGLTYEAIEKGDNIYPYKGEPLRGAKEDIQVDRSTRSATAGTLYLKIEKPLFHSGTMSTKAPALVNIYPRSVARVSAETAQALSLTEGDVVRVKTKTGSLELFVAIEKAGDSSSVKVGNNFEGKNAFRLTDCILDPVTKAPCMDSIGITIEKVTA